MHNDEHIDDVNYVAQDKRSGRWVKMFKLRKSDWEWASEIRGPVTKEALRFEPCGFASIPTIDHQLLPILQADELAA